MPAEAEPAHVTPEELQPSPGEFVPGTRFGGFEVVSLIGRGGMGAVYKAYQSELDRVVVIKTLNESVASDPTYLERFNREARAASRVQHHPHVVSTYAFGAHD